MPHSLYIHIPFCIKKCRYCDFTSLPFSSELSGEYIDALCKEIALRRDLIGEVKTLYIGGGTPTILSAEAITRIFDSIRTYSTIPLDAEITIEANPGTITEEKVEALLHAGVNRMSIGVQSFSDKELALLGRVHSAQEAQEAIQIIKCAGCNNISIDLIYGIPGQKEEEWEGSLDRAVAVSPQHISTYELTLEGGTPMFEMVQRGALTMPHEDTIASMYNRTIDIVEAYGYTHYEISNFAKPGHECRHNLNYWNRGEYLGLGVSAHSFFTHKRQGTTKSIREYIEQVKKGRIPVEEEVSLTGHEALKEYIFLGLRKTEGIDLSQIPEAARAGIEEASLELIQAGLVELDGSHLKLTRKGLLLSSEVIVRVLLQIE